MPSPSAISAVGNVTNPNGVSHTGDSYYKCGSGAGDLHISMLGGAASTIKTVNGGKLTHVDGVGNIGSG